MRKIIFQMMVSIDGFFEGPNRELDWHNVDAEFNQYAIDLLRNVDTLLFGRVTYELMASYWPKPQIILKGDEIVAERMNNLPKIVFSKTLKKAEWNNTKLVKENVADEILKLKAQPGKDMAMFGSSNLALTFIEHNLIDEYRIIVNPIVLGQGHTFLRGLNTKLRLELFKTKTFKSGNVMLCYHPVT